VAKIARQLGFDHAEAVVRTPCSPKLAAVILPHVLGHRWAQTSFEFRKGKAFPVISGIVVAAENEDTILEASVLCSPAERNCLLEQFLIKAYWEVEHAAAQKEQEKRQQAVLKRWTKLVQGLRIHQRIREQYGAHGSGALGARNAGSRPAAAHIDDEQEQEQELGEGGVQRATAGGFLTSVEDVVQPYSLPRPTHAVFSSPPRSPRPSGRASPVPLTAQSARPAPASPASAEDDEEGDVGDEPRFHTEDLDVGTPHRQHPQRRVPKSMAALAAEVAQAEAAAARLSEEDDAASASVSVSVSASATTPHRTTARRRATSTSKSKSKSRTTAKATTTKAQTQSRRKRARTREDEADADASGSDSGSEGKLERGGDDDGDDGDDDVDMDVDGERPRAAKRARRQRRDRSLRADPDPDSDAAGAGADVEVPVSVTRSDRVLRTRKGKSAEQRAREREQELAVKRALAG